MSDTQLSGLPVHGYRPQSTNAVEIVNYNKQVEERLLRMIETLVASGDADKRWLAVAKTFFEEGFMAINRAVFKPGRVELEGE